MQLFPFHLTTNWSPIRSDYAHTHTIAIYVRNEDQVWNSPTLGRHSIYKPDFFTVRFTLLSSTQLLADVMQTAITLHLRRPNSWLCISVLADLTASLLVNHHLRILFSVVYCITWLTTELLPWWYVHSVGKWIQFVLMYRVTNEISHLPCVHEIWHFLDCS